MCDARNTIAVEGVPWRLPPLEGMLCADVGLRRKGAVRLIRLDGKLLASRRGSRCCFGVQSEALRYV